jgi:hypothetical protein
MQFQKYKQTIGGQKSPEVSLDTEAGNGTNNKKNTNQKGDQIIKEGLLCFSQAV